MQKTSQFSFDSFKEPKRLSDKRTFNRGQLSFSLNRKSFLPSLPFSASLGIHNSGRQNRMRHFSRLTLQKQLNPSLRFQLELVDLSKPSLTLDYLQVIPVIVEQSLVSTCADRPTASAADDASAVGFGSEQHDDFGAQKPVQAASVVRLLSATERSAGNALGSAGTGGLRAEGAVHQRLGSEQGRFADAAGNHMHLRNPGRVRNTEFGNVASNKTPSISLANSNHQQTEPAILRFQQAPRQDGLPRAVRSGLFTCSRDEQHGTARTLIARVGQGKGLGANEWATRGGVTRWIKDSRAG